MRKLGLTLLCLLAIFGLARAADVTNIFQMPATTCSNQFVRTITTITGAGGCASIANADLTSLAGQYPGVATNTAATAGNIGELVTATAATGTVSLVNNTGKTITSISLTAGEWDITGVIDFGTSGTTTVSSYYCFISLTNNTTDATEGVSTANAYLATGQAISVQTELGCPIVRKSFSGTTSVFLVALSAFGTSTLTAGGFIRATRIH